MNSLYFSHVNELVTSNPRFWPFFSQKMPFFASKMPFFSQKSLLFRPSRTALPAAMNGTETAFTLSFVAGTEFYSLGSPSD
jgi:hypothetical protein